MKIFIIGIALSMSAIFVCIYGILYGITGLIFELDPDKHLKFVILGAMLIFIFTLGRQI